MNRFAKAIDYPQPSLSAIESGSRPISKVLATILTSRYNISSDWLLFGKGNMFNVEGMQQVSLEYDQKANVLFYDIEALAGNGLSVTKSEEVIERWHIPSLIGEHIAVSISGNSMEPTLKDGDKVIAKRVLSAADIRHNTIYILVYDGAPVIKRVHLVQGGLELRSDNVFYAAVIADVTLVGDMYLVVGYYRDMGFGVVSL